MDCIKHHASITKQFEHTFAPVTPIPLQTRRRRATSPQLDDGMTAEQFKHLAEECGLEESWRPAVGLLCQLGLRQSELARLSESRPEVFQISAGTMRRKLAFLRETVGLSDIELTKVVVKCPRILEYQSESVKTRLAFLKGAGIAPKDVAKVVLKAPMIMALSVDDTLRPRAAFLREEVYLAEGKLGKLFARHPQVLTCTEDMMRQRVQFLMQECGLETEDLAHAVLAHPQVLHYKIDSMRTRLDYLRSIGMSAEQIAAGVARFPQIFSLSVATNMAPKWHYLVEHLGGNLTSLVAYPAYFSLSLAKRIVPRHRYLQQLRGGNLPLPVSMTVLKMTDKKFAVEVARTSLQEYESFREAIVEQFENAAAEASFQRSRTADTSHSDEGEGHESEARVIAAAEDCNNESSEDWAMLMAPVQRLPGTGGPTTLGNRRPGGLSDLYAAKNGRALSASPLSTQRQNPLVRRAHPE
jgi:hypothetical protein